MTTIGEPTTTDEPTVAADPSTIPAMPVVSDRVRDLHARMTLEEKLAKITG